MNLNSPKKSSHNLPQGPECVNPYHKEDPEGHSGGKKSLLKAAGMMSGLTLISRILGMARDIICAKSFGTSWLWDGFIYAFMIPNFFRRLVAEGALSSAFIPVYSETLEKQGKERALYFANVAMTCLLFILGIFVLVLQGILFLALQIDSLSPTLELALSLMRYFFPLLALMSLFALGMGILNSHKHFFVPSLAPIILNSFWIISVLWVAPRMAGDLQSQLYILAGGLFLAGLTQLISQLPVLHSLQFRIKWIWDWACPEIKKTGKLLLPAFLGFAVVPVNVLVDMTLGLWIGEGANSSLWYGNRLMQFPLAIFAIAMGTALLPTLSRHVAAGENEEVEKTVRFALKSVLFIIFPCTVGLIALREPIIKMLFERGAFDSESTMRTAQVLFCYSIGLFAFSSQKIITTGFYAQQDTKTPAKIAIAALLLNIVLNLILMQPLREAGLALATSLSGIFQLVTLIYFYKRKGLKLDVGDLTFSSSKLLILSFVMGAVSLWSYYFCTDIWSGNHLGAQSLCVFIPIVLSTICYGGLSYFFRISEFKQLLSKRLQKK